MTNSKQQATKGRPAAGAVRMFRDLAMWQRAQELSMLVLDVVAELPPNRLNAILTDQLMRCVTSIGANIAEGHGRYMTGSYRQHLSVARGSTSETMSWIDLLRRRQLISPEQEAAVMSLCDEIMRMLTAMMIQLEKPAKPPRRVGEEREAYDA
jgi:four helix bundle protein